MDGAGAGHVVAHIVKKLGIVSETFVTNSIVAVQNEGWRSCVLGVEGEIQPGELDGIPVHRVTERSLVRCAVDRLLLRHPERAAAVQMRSQAKAWEVELLHAHFGWSAVYAVELAGMLDVPFVVTFYGSDASAPPQLRGSAPGGPSSTPHPYRRVFAEAERIIAVSHYVEDRLRALGCEREIDVVRNGLALPSLTQRTQPPPLTGDVRLLFIGRLTPVKGAEVLLRALPAVLERHPRVRLELIGDGPDRAKLEALARSLGIVDATAFRGALPHGQVLASLRDAHLLVVPSVSLPNGQAEASSMVLKEALAVGVPVAATSSGGLPETCPPEFRAELAAPGDSTALAASITRLLDEPGDWPRRVAIGRDWVTGRFDLDRMAKSLSRCYWQAFERRRGDIDPSQLARAA